MEEFSEEPGCGGAGKYLDLGNKKTNPALMAIAMALAGGSSGGLGVDGGIIPQAQRVATENSSLAGLLTGKKQNNDAPPAYLNYIFFDKEMNYKYGGYTHNSSRTRSG